MQASVSGYFTPLSVTPSTAPPSGISDRYVPNASALGSLCFVMILLCPIPILLYADSIQKQLHRRLYTILGGLALLDFAVCSILTFFGIADYIETLPIG